MSANMMAVSLRCITLPSAVGRSSSSVVMRMDPQLRRSACCYPGERGWIIWVVPWHRPCPGLVPHLRYFRVTKRSHGDDARSRECGLDPLFSRTSPGGRRARGLSAYDRRSAEDCSGDARRDSPMAGSHTSRKTAAGVGFGAGPVCSVPRLCSRAGLSTEQCPESRVAPYRIVQGIELEGTPADG